MKLIKKLLLRLFLLILILSSIILFIGYTYYSKTLQEQSLASRVNAITSKENYTSFSELSPIYVNAVIATEDHRYYKHGPIDLIGIGRAMYSNIKNKEFREGGSTITQQVSKNVIFNQDRTLIRKVGELLCAFDLEKNYSKEEIFAIYVNSCYFGDGYYSVYDACKGYFNKLPKDLNLDEASMLAGIPNAPSLYSPTVNMKLCRKRQSHVLNKMVDYGYITKEEANSIKSKSN